MNDFALDSVTVNTIATPRQKVVKSSAIDKALAKGAKIRVDPHLAVVSEWEECCGREIVQQLIVHWDQWGALLPVDRLGRIDAAVAKKLKQSGFTDTGDKLVLKIAIASETKRIVSSDGDFWDPRVKASKCLGDNSAVVCKLLRERLGVTVLTLKTFVRL